MKTTVANRLRSIAWRGAKSVPAVLPLGVTDQVARLLEGAARRETSQSSRLAEVWRTLGAVVAAGAADRRMERVWKAVRERRFEAAAAIYRQAIATQPTVSTIYEPGRHLAMSGELNDQFTLAAIATIKAPELRAMVSSLMRAPAIYHPSRLWLYFLVYNALQLDTAGVEHFKETVNANYFNWTGDADVELQTRSLQQTMGLDDRGVDRLLRDVEAPAALRPPAFSVRQWSRYGRLVALLAERAAQCDRLGLLRSSVEPAIGHPVGVRYRGRFVTQDLCNSIIDVNTMAEGAPDLVTGPVHVAELGAGSGRIESVLLRANPKLRATIIDIPPALYVSQWYLRQVFPERRVFAFREFDDFATVREEFEAASLAFLAPHQVELLPPGVFDGFINICSLQEMTPAQIALWFGHVDRLTRGWFFTKQYKTTTNPFDEVTIRREDYPARPSWKVAFDRDNPQNQSLFEAMYRLG